MESNTEHVYYTLAERGCCTNPLTLMPYNGHPYFIEFNDERFETLEAALADIRQYYPKAYVSVRYSNVPGEHHVDINSNFSHMIIREHKAE